MGNTHRLPAFTWKGLDAHQNKIAGEMDAVNLNFARVALVKQGITPLCIRQKHAGLSLFSSQRISFNDITELLRQLALLLNAGISLLKALSIIAASLQKPNLNRLIQAISLNIQEGSSIAETFSQHSNHFDHLTLQLIYAGEQSGTLEKQLDRIVTHREKKQAVKNKIKKALYYPSFILFCSLLLVYLLCILVIPQFSQLFSAFGSQLPGITQIVIQTANHATQIGLIATFVLFSLVSTVIFLTKKYTHVQQIVDQWSLRVPIYGQFYRKNFLIQFAHTLSISMAAGIPIQDALNLLTSISKNSFFKENIIRLSNLVQSGKPLHEALKISLLFTPMAIQMIAIGEEAGKLEEILEKVANWYTIELNQSIEVLNQLVEPAVMMIVGSIVGFIIIALYLPIFKLGMVI